jgi:RNA polymerase sigma-70 factor (ECF subfamily)
VREESPVDRQTFQQQALSHLDSVYRLAVQLSRHPDEAADLVQETYLKAIRVSADFEEKGGGMRPWLFRILHNVFYSRKRRERRHGAAQHEFHDEPADGPLPGDPPRVWDLASLDWSHVDGRMKLAIEQLKPEYRAVLLLWGVEGLKYREIAEIQNVPIGTVMSRLHRARAIVAAQLTEFAEESGIRGRSPVDGRISTSQGH